MNPTLTEYLLVSVVGGAAGAVALYGGVRALNALGWARGDILLALGHIFLHRRPRAFQLGLLLHAVTSVAFAPWYLLILSKTGFVAFPGALMAGAFFGFLHGLFVSLGLVWVASNQPMLPEFTGARLPFGVMHFAAHIAYGATVGSVIALTLG
jgi:hypothetical protein